MAEPSPFEKRFASRLVQTGRMSRDQVLAYFRQRNSDPGTTNAPTLPRLDQYLVGVGALTAGEVDSIVRQLEEGSRTVVQDNPMIGKVLAGYRVVELVGAGGMGELYRAHDPSLDKDFAIKVISPAAARNPNYVRRLQQEAKLASRIDDPHLVPILKLGEEGGQVFCVMPFIEGRNVADHVRASGGLPLPEALAIVEQAARGLAAIHRAGIIHRDVKPENLLIGPDGRVRLTDFGLARDLNSDSSLTATGQLLGTPYYMSPEQATGIGVDERTDIYSLGLTFYFLLAGRPPFEGTSPLSVLDKHRREPLPDPAVANPGARGEPIKLLRRMTAKDPVERPRSMDEVIADLETLRAHGRIRGPRRNFALPGPRVLGAAGALSLAGAAILVAFALAGGPPDPEPTPDPVPDSVRDPDPETADPEALAHALLEEAERLRAEHGREPRNLPRILAAFRQVVAAHPQGEAARTSRMVITGLEIELERAYAWRLAQIDREVHPRIQQLEIRPALDLFRDAGREFDDPGWLERVETKRNEAVAEITGRIDAEIAERRRMLPEESFREIASTHQRIRHALSRDALELLGAETAARLERELEAMAEAVEQELSKRAATWREWVERLRRGERLQIPELVLLRAGLEEAREHPKAPPGLPEILEGIEDQLTQLRAESMQQVYEAVLRDDRDAARHHFREVLSTFPSTDRIRPPRETSEVDRFLDILRRDRQAMWAALRARDGASFERAAAVWHERETTHPERALVPARLGWTPPDYPYPAEVEPIAICAAFRRKLAEFWARFDDRRPRVVHFRAIGEPARRRRVVQKTDEGPLAWRLHGEPTSSRRIFDPLRTIEPADLLAIYLGDSLEAEAASEAIPPTEAFAAAVIMLYLDRIDEARAIVKAGREADPDRPWPRLEAWLALAEGSRSGGEEPDPPRDVESAVRDAFGRHAQVFGREGDLVHVRISYDFEDPQQLLHFIRSPTSKASIEHGHLHLQDEDRGGAGTSVLRLRGEWRGDLAFEILLKPEESSRPFRLCVVYLIAREENSMRIERCIEAGIRANPKGAEVFLQTVRSGRDSIAPIGRSVEASFEAGRYYRLQGRVQGNRHELGLADRDGNRPGISTDGDAEPLPAGEIEIVWTNREFWVDSLRIEGRVSIESLTR